MTVLENTFDDPRMVFAVLVGKCGKGLAKELIAEGKTPKQARNYIIHQLLNFAAGEACRVARAEGRDPDPEKWRAAVDKAFAQAVERTRRVRA